MIICIVGKSGSGKSYISKLLQSFSKDIIHLDIDTISHEILTIPNVYKKIVNVFGESVSNIDNKTIDRRALGNIVFNSVTEMNKLTDITWPPMQPIIDNFIIKNRNKVLILDWQLLLKTKYYNMSDLTILVTAPYNLRMQKTMIRDNINEDIFLTRDKASFDFSSYEFDYVINNDYSDKVKEKVKEIYDKSIISR